MLRRRNSDPNLDRLALNGLRFTQMYTPMEGMSLRPAFNGSPLPDRTFVFSHMGTQKQFTEEAWRTGIFPGR